MTSLLSEPDCILPRIKAASPAEALLQIASALEQATGVGAELIYSALHKSEQELGSGIGDGVAVPQARLSDMMLSRRLCAYAQVTPGVMFNGTDNKPCDLIFAILSPERDGPVHLRRLSIAARSLKDSDFAARLRAAEQPDRIMSLFKARNAAAQALAA